jgi:hypothetical protein
MHEGRSPGLNLHKDDLVLIISMDIVEAEQGLKIVVIIPI